MFGKKIAAILLIAMSLPAAVLASCSGEEVGVINNEKNEGISKEPVLRIIELEEKDPPTVVSSIWEYYDEEQWIKRSVAIFRGTVTDKKELLLEEKISDEFTNKSYTSVYSFKISELYYSEDSQVKTGDTIKILSGTTSYNWEVEAVKIDKGKEYIIFADLTENTTKATKYTSLAKYVLGNPWTPIIPIKGDIFEIDGVFSSLTRDARSEERKISDDYSKEVFVRDDEDFIPDLKELIQKYK